LAIGVIVIPLGRLAATLAAIFAAGVVADLARGVMERPLAMTADDGFMAGEDPSVQ
jgi:hypothetical protein